MSKKTHDITNKTKYAFATGEIGDSMAYQSFSFLIFTFYFTVVKLDVRFISTGFIIWSLWNSLNDPLMGYFSDKTKSKWGRRIPWMVGAIVPLALIMILLFTPPISGSDTEKFIYFMIMLFTFDFAYTAFNLNFNAMFSEMFTDVKTRSEVGQIRIVFVIIGLIVAFVVPTLIIQDLTNQNEYDYTQTQYIINGIVAAIVIIITYSIVIKFGVRNSSTFSKDAENTPSFFKSLSLTFKNKAFLIYLLPALGTWIVIGILPAVIPLWASHILKITEEDSILTGVLLLAAFLVSGASTPLWLKIRKAKGARMAGIAGVGVWMLTILLFLIADDFISGLLVMMVIGIGLGGGLYFYDQCLAEIIDEDEVNTGVRNSGMYYGIINLIIRLSGVINYLVIGIVFVGSEWETYTPNPNIDTLLGIKFLLAWFPFIVLVISMVGLYFYPIKGKRLMDIRHKLDELHIKKRENEE